MEFAEDDLPLPSFNELFGPNLSRGKRKHTSQEIYSDAATTGRWTEQEHLKFLEGIKLYGRDFKKIKSLIQSRNVIQIRTHAQKVLKAVCPKEYNEDSWDSAITSLLEKELGMRESRPGADIEGNVEISYCTRAGNPNVSCES